MSSKYKTEELAVSKAIEALQNGEYSNPSAAAKAFNINPVRVRRRLKGKNSKSSRLPSNRALSEGQELAIREYVLSLDSIDVLPARLSVMVRDAANYLLWEAHTDTTRAPRSVGVVWSKRFLSRNPKLCKHQAEPVLTEGEPLLGDGSMAEGSSMRMSEDMAGDGEHTAGNGTVQGPGGHEEYLVPAAPNGTGMPSSLPLGATGEPGLEADGTMLDNTASETPSTVEVEQKSSADKISHFGFKRALDRYPGLIAQLSGTSKPSKLRDGQPSSSNLTLQELDNLRLHSLPAELQSEERASAPFLLRDEVESLLRWKLKHGTFRPRLMELVQMNEPAKVFDVTKSAFKTYEENPEDYVIAIKELVSLTGVGPATASLLLSVYDNLNVPFFSDEGFRWIMFEERHGKGWDRKIKYDLKEYQIYFTKVKELRVRLSKQSGEEIKAVDVEKVAFVLGKEAAGVKVGTDDPSPRQQQDTEIEDGEESNVSPPPVRKKRGRPSTAKAQVSQNNKKKGSQVSRKQAPAVSTKVQKNTKVTTIRNSGVEDFGSEENDQPTTRAKRPKRAKA